MSEPVVKRVKLSKFRLWAITLFPDGLTDDPTQSNPIVFPPCRWAVASLERAPTTGKLHIQGAIYYESQVHLSRLRTDFGDSGHYEPAKGTAQQNLDYCSKSETHVAGPWTVGTLPQQGKRSDWHAVADMVKQKKTFNEIVTTYPHLAPMSKGITTLMEACLPPPTVIRDMTTIFIWGPSGVGKTHLALTTYPEAYLIRGKYMEGKSFDMYNNETVLILDEWDPSEWPLTEMNKLTDKWKCPLTCRYNNKYGRWNIVVITSVRSPHDCYSLNVRAQFLRRLTEIKYISVRPDL